MPKIETISQILPIIVEPTLPSDPALRAILDDALAKFHYSLISVAAEDGPAAPGSLDQVFRTFLATRSAPTRARFRERGRGLLEGPASLRATHFGRYANISPKEYMALGSDGVTSRASKLKVDTAALEKSCERLRNRFSLVPSAVLKTPVTAQAGAGAAPKIKLHLDPDFVAGFAFKKMRLFIRSVRCNEETDEIGSDEINLGGTVTDPFGNTSIVDQFEVSHDFDEDETVDFGMSKVFTSWNLQTKSEGFPYVYAAVIAMAEKDDGGFYKFLKELWEKIDEEVKKLVGGLVGAAIGGAIGSFFGPVGTIAGVIVGALVGALIDWIIGWFDNPDDIVGTKPVLMTLASCKKSYYDWAKLTTPEGWKTTLNFKGDGGRYLVNCSYKVFTQ